VVAARDVLFDLCSLSTKVSDATIDVVDGETCCLATYCFREEIEPALGLSGECDAALAERVLIELGALRFAC